ncbi:MAG: pilus assembly protein PilP, partial [Deltaproteobacteria bacterium]|nr:pilus assembly protein PilP [Deltaproteobacteria bacterium]
RNEPIDSQFYSIIPVEMEMEGTYSQIATFFDYIGKLTRIVNITNINLVNPVQDSNGRVTMKSQVMATTYRYKPEKSPGRSAGGAK